MRGLAESAPKLAAEMRTRQSRGAREIGHGERVEVPRVGQVLRPQQVTCRQNHEAQSREQRGSAPGYDAAGSKLSRIMIFCHTLFDNEPVRSWMPLTAASTIGSCDSCAYNAASLLVNESISLQ